jgi:hypothetical protein
MARLHLSGRDFHPLFTNDLARPLLTPTIIAIAMMVFTEIYQMFITGAVWNPSDLYKIDMPHP